MGDLLKDPESRRVYLSSIVLHACREAKCLVEVRLSMDQTMRNLISDYEKLHIRVSIVSMAHNTDCFNCLR